MKFVSDLEAFLNPRECAHILEDVATSWRMYKVHLGMVLKVSLDLDQYNSAI
jgi:hypothetical protein